MGWDGSLSRGTQQKLPYCTCIVYLYLNVTPKGELLAKVRQCIWVCMYFNSFILIWTMNFTWSIYVTGKIGTHIIKGSHGLCPINNSDNLECQPQITTMLHVHVPMNLCFLFCTTLHSSCLFIVIWNYRFTGGTLSHSTQILLSEYASFKQ